MFLIFRKCEPWMIIPTMFLSFCQISGWKKSLTTFNEDTEVANDICF